MEDWKPNIIAIALGAIFAISLLFTVINGYRLYTLGLDYTWKTETCTYIPAPDKDRGEEECKYDGSRAAREATEATGAFLGLGLLSAWSYRRLRK